MAGMFVTIEQWRAGFCWEIGSRVWHTFDDVDD